MKRTVFFSLLLFIISSSSFSQGKLEKAEKGLSKNNNYYSSPSNSRTSSSSSYDNNSLWGGLAMVFIEIGLYATYYGLIESPTEQEHRASNAFITKHPYHSSNRGNYAYNWDGDTNLSRITLTNRFIAENSELYGNHLNADFRFLRRLSIEADYLQLWENNTFFGNNSLATFTFLAKYHRVRTERFNAYWGMGATYIGGDVEELGFTYGIGAEYFFAKPLSLELNYNQTLINTRSSDKLNFSLNYHIDRFKVTGGYEYLRIGGIGFSTFSVGVGIFI
ncbi:outer membrane beta-barrel protein [uncultured Aquimarina sp.]|uniref:outer membrane beta-barrel protein n=1 Tax=uncultured Aquimarina sp. TaxID=575652 RepID=UPI00261E5D9E|nr:outer membrane beta-barrel protein [uncultured Aquimarina sp.]